MNNAQLVRGGEAALTASTRVFARAAVLFGVLTTAFVAVVAFHIGGDWFSNSFDDLGELVAALVAAAACVVTSRRQRRISASWPPCRWQWSGCTRCFRARHVVARDSGRCSEGPWWEPVCWSSSGP